MLSAGSPSATPHFSFPIERLTLRNGLRVVLQPDHQVPLVAVQASYEAGSRAEPAERSGLAHLCEHLAFTGPTNHSHGNYPALIERRGGVANGSTSQDYTRFNTLLPSRELALGLWVEAQRMSGMAARIEPEAIEVQRKVLQEERRQRAENRPYGQALEQLHRLLYPADHPYHGSPSGSLSGLRAITAEDVESFFVSLYTPRNMILTLTGDLRPDEVGQLLEDLLASLPEGEEPPDPRRPVLALLASAQRSVLEDRVPAVRTYVGFRAAGFAQRGWHAAILLSEYLAVGRTSPLKRLLIQEQGLAQDVEVYLITMRDACTLAFSATAAPGVDRRRLEDGLLAGCEQLLCAGMTEPVLRRLQKRVVKGVYHKLHDLIDRAAFCSNLKAWFDAPVPLIDVVEHFSDLDPDDLAAFGHELCRPQNRAVLSVVPAGGDAEGGRS